MPAGCCGSGGHGRRRRRSCPRRDRADGTPTVLPGLQTRLILRLSALLPPFHLVVLLRLVRQRRKEGGTTGIFLTSRSFAALRLTLLPLNPVLGGHEKRHRRGRDQPQSGADVLHHLRRQSLPRSQEALPRSSRTSTAGLRRAFRPGTQAWQPSTHKGRSQDGNPSLRCRATFLRDVMCGVGEGGGSKEGVAVLALIFYLG